VSEDSEDKQSISQERRETLEIPPRAPERAPMKCAYLTQRGFELKDTPVPEIAADEMLIRTGSTGICEGDVFTFKRRENLKGEHRLGHEGSGTVEKTGKNIVLFHPGDRVTSMADSGAFCEYFIARESEVVRLPDTVEFEWALGEPLACCVHASERFGIGENRRVAVLGCGFMGLTCLQLAKHHGTGYLLAVDPVRERAEIAKALGADECECGGVSSRKHEINNTFDIVIEASGTQAALRDAGDLVAHHGRLVIVGYHQSAGGHRQVNMRQWNYKAIDVVNGHVRSRDKKLVAMKEGVRLLDRKTVDTENLVTVYPLSRIQEAFESVERRDRGIIKAVVRADEQI
jgi:threonine dehydrogenase-like Zn-dependent dehydrogenase